MSKAKPGSSFTQVKKLQDVLKPLLLRRMKEDVETLPEKEEVGSLTNVIEQIPGNMHRGKGMALIT